jgi:hypothetical protein
MDVWEYFVQKEREFADLSLTADRQSSDLFAEEAGSNGQRGRIFGNLNLDSPVPAFLAVSELVVVEGNHVRREESGYFLVIKGVEIWGYERDLSPMTRLSIDTHKVIRSGWKPIQFRSRRLPRWRGRKSQTPR